MSSTLLCSTSKIKAVGFRRLCCSEIDPVIILVGGQGEGGGGGERGRERRGSEGGKG